MERTELKLFRIKQKLTQEQFAKEVGYSRMHYAKIEKGEKEIPLKMLVAISEKYEMTLDEVRELTNRDNERKE